MQKENLTLLSCSYNTPKITKAMLQSFIYFFGKEFPIFIVENSTDEETVKILEDNSISYFRNPGGTHSPSVDIAIENCKTDYALLVDTDILFQQGSLELLRALMKSDMTLAGSVCGDRAGHVLHPRVHPWFMYINIKNIKENNIKFHDAKRIIESHSEQFYNSFPFAKHDESIRKYDVGATFYEDVNSAGLKIFDCPTMENLYLHFEGSSWAFNIPGSEDKFANLMKMHEQYKKPYDTVNINFK